MNPKANEEQLKVPLRQFKVPVTQRVRDVFNNEPTKVYSVEEVADRIPGVDRKYVGSLLSHLVRKSELCSAGRGLYCLPGRSAKEAAVIHSQQIQPIEDILEQLQEIRNKLRAEKDQLVTQRDALQAKIDLIDESLHYTGQQ